MTLHITAVSQGQSLAAYEQQKSPSVAHAWDTYINYLGVDAEIFNGRVYNDYRSSLFSGSPLLSVAQNTLGDVVYNGIWYRNLPLMYDVYKDVLLGFKYGDNLLYEIEKSRISLFHLGEREFVHLNTASYPNAAPGFYEVLFKGGKSNVWVKYGKEYSEDLGSTSTRRILTDRVQYFIEKQGMFNRVNSARAILKQYNDKQDEMKKYIKDHGLNAKKNMYHMLKELAAFYEVI
ncbi:hypothetical protein [Niabella aquatica]